MKKTEMGRYYHSNVFGLVKVICRAIDHLSGESMIIYAQVGKNGCASEPWAMEEREFENTYVMDLNPS